MLIPSSGEGRRRRRRRKTPYSQILPYGLASSISSLDRDMKHILLDASMDDYTKAHLYQQALQRYLVLADKYRHKPLGKVEITTPQPTLGLRSTEEDLNKIKSTVIQNVPNQFRNKAELLWNHIEKIPDISWDGKNQLVLGNETVEGSNVIDLVNDLVRQRKSRQPPKGWTSLANAL